MAAIDPHGRESQLPPWRNVVMLGLGHVEYLRAVDADVTTFPRGALIRYGAATATEPSLMFCS
jgi:hypothetical protein